MSAINATPKSATPAMHALSDTPVVASLSSCAPASAPSASRRAGLALLLTVAAIASLASAIACAATTAPSPAAPTPADLAAGQRTFALCASCHQIGGNAGAAFGPQLTGIVG